MNREGDGSSCDRRFGQGWSRRRVGGYQLWVGIVNFVSIEINRGFVYNETMKAFKTNSWRFSHEY